MPGEKILLVQTGFLGDVILSTPVIKTLRRLYPDSPITVLTTPLAAPLIEFNPDVAAVIRYDKRGADRGFLGFFRLAAELRRCNFSTVFSLHKSYRTAALLAAARIGNRFGFSEAALPWLYTRTASRSGCAHEVQRNLAIFKAVEADAASVDQSMAVYFPPEMPALVAERLGFRPDEKLVGLAPGSVWATKRWTVEGFSELARKLAGAGQRVVLIGGPDDSAVGAEIERTAGVPVVNLIGKLSLLESACLISQLRILVSNDSAPLHLASAARTPVVAIFCATVPEFGYGPWQTENEVVGVSGLSCRPCGRHGGQHCPTGTHACQRQLSADTVFQAAVRLMTRTTPQRMSGGLPQH